MPRKKKKEELVMINKNFKPGKVLGQKRFAPTARQATQQPN